MCVLHTFKLLGKSESYDYMVEDITWRWCMRNMLESSCWRSSMFFCVWFFFKNLDIFLPFVGVLFFLRFNLFIFRQWGREGEREGEKHQCVVASHLPAPPLTHWGPGPQPRHVPWLGIELVTIRFTGWHSVHRATLVRAVGVLDQFGFL